MHLPRQRSYPTRASQLAAVAVVLMTVTLPARAVADPIGITSVGDVVQVAFDGSVDETLIAGLSSELSLGFLGFSYDSVFNRTTASFLATVKNTSTNPVTGSRVSAFGFDITPDVWSANPGDTTSPIFDQVLAGGTFPNQAGDVEVCISGNTCTAGGGTGVSIGDALSFNLMLYFTGAVDELALENFKVRYQSIEGISQGTSGTGLGAATFIAGQDSEDTETVPEPATILMLGAGFGMAARRYRRRQQ